GVSTIKSNCVACGSSWAKSKRACWSTLWFVRPLCWRSMANTWWVTWFCRSSARTGVKPSAHI
ncbi:hypothetical protein, partial [Pseudomonas extremaustralis]|uniref:hypothetical protein n=1 Tax=Pseudomonas extremaustralis TaxID=359110 RepID=UPI003F8CD181